MTSPCRSLVFSLKSLTNCPILTPCWPRAGPTGGAGVAWPPGHWSLIFALISLAMLRVRLFDLPVFEIDRGRPTEDHDRDLDHALLGMDFLYGPFEVLERAFLDSHVLALLEVDGDLGRRVRDALDLLEHLRDLVGRHGLRLVRLV